MRRGFLRLYVVVCVIWMAFFIGVTVVDKNDGDRYLALGMAFGVPLLAYLLFFVAAPWIAAGFRKK
jgi:hypothetical protein